MKLRKHDVIFIFIFQGGVSAGVLTTLGRDHAFELGQKIRAKYIGQHKLIGNQYNQKEIL